nr:hypothetical protein [Herbidospora sakaeratensis]
MGTVSGSHSADIVGDQPPLPTRFQIATSPHRSPASRSPDSSNTREVGP